MKTCIFILLFLFLGFADLDGQSVTTDNVPFPSASMGLKTNLLYDLTSTLNLGLEFKTGRQYTMDFSVNYNPWTFRRNKKFKHLLVQPEIRYWFCEPFNGHFLGIHGLYVRYNAGGIHFPFLTSKKNESTRYQGNLYGAGIGYGYQWYLSPRWNLEATLGLGYVYFDYTAYSRQCNTCTKELYDNDKHYFGPTKLAVSLIYIIK
ncbi:MAG TPA: DUF3575 domain-containing protein [Porphyromonadaceae bacterium]|nr:DUF3575 domain-containing protein [Porphyromonadaceae bacterium]